MSPSGEHLTAEPGPVDAVSDDELLTLDAYREALDAGQRVSPEDWIRRNPQAGSALRALRALAALHDPQQTQAEGFRAGTPVSALTQSGAATTVSFTFQAPDIPGYEFLGLCGRGGRGVVWKARRTDLGRLEAVKMILAGQFAEAAEVERFLREVKLAAGLSHPNIVKVHDAGIVAGQPYLTMEYIDGKTLAQVAQGPDALPVRKAAEYVKTIALAVQYLHEHNILHRDLKPANVLLEGSGLGVQGSVPVARSATSSLTPDPRILNPKVTDFGLARRIEGGSELTASGDVLGSPSYMPPEQAAGQITRLGPWTDVYGLGAILYELLVGRPPFRAETPAATVNQVLDAELEPVAPSQLNPQVDRDLNTICTKALAKDPSRRYQAARELAEDVDRWLTGEPIQARPVGRVGRCWRWCRRKPAIASLAAALVVALIGGITAVTWQWVRAETNFRRANRSLDELASAYGHHGELLGQVRSKAEALEVHQRERATLERLVQDNPTNTASQGALAGCYMNIGNRQGDLGQRDAARESYRRAIEIWEKLVRANPSAAGFHKELAKTYSNLGVLQRQTGQLDEAIHSQRRALDIRERLAGDHPTVAELQNELASSHQNTGVLQSYVGRLADALGSFQRACEIRERLVRDQPGEAQFQSALAGTYDRIAAVQAALGRPDQARLLYDKVREIREKLAHDYPAIIAYQKALGDDLLEIATFLDKTGQPEAATGMYRQAIEILEKLVAADPAVTEYQSLLAASYGNLGLVLRASKPAESLDYYEKARQRFEMLVHWVPSSSLYKAELASSHDAIGNLRSSIGPADEAFRSYEKAIELREQLVRDNPNVPEYRRNVAASYNNVGTLHEDTGQSARAMQFYERAREIRQQLVHDYPDIAQHRSELGEIYRNIADQWRELGQWAEALESLQQAREVYDQLIEKHPDDAKHSSDLGRTVYSIGSALAQMGRHEDALVEFERAIRYQQAALDKSPQTRRYRGLLSEHYSALAQEQRGLLRPAEATRTALDRKKLWPNNPVELYNVACELALCAPLVGHGKTELTPVEQTNREKCAELAIDVLREAIAAGFQEFDHMQKDPDLDAIRAHVEFQDLFNPRR